MSRVCQQHDYDRKFATVLSLLQETGGDTNPPETTRVDKLLLQLPANQWRKLGAREWRERSTRKSTSLIGHLHTERILKGLLAIRVILRDPTLRGLLVAGALCQCRGAKIGPSRLVADLFRLSILRREDPQVTRLGIGFEVRAQYDRQKERLVIETIGPEDVPAPSQADVYSWPSKHGPLREIIWDHSAIGTVVPIILAGRPAWVFIGPTGQYRFRALAALAERDAEGVWEAFRPLATSGR
jgi:hypothetical protein